MCEYKSACFLDADNNILGKNNLVTNVCAVLKMCEYKSACFLDADNNILGKNNLIFEVSSNCIPSLFRYKAGP